MVEALKITRRVSAFSRRVCCVRALFDARRRSPDERSDIRERRCKLHDRARMSLRSSGLRRRRKKEKRRRNAERRVVTIRATADERYRSPRLRARRRPLPTLPRKRGRVGRGRLASRRSIAALAGRLSPCRLSSRPGFRGRGRSVFAGRALPAPSCPSPEAAPLTAAVVPQRVMPGAARARRARPRAGTALAPTARLAVRAASLLSEYLRIA